MDDMYTEFMNRCKTERECVAEIKMFAEESGFRDIKSLSTLSKGDKIYSVNRGRSLILMSIGELDKIRIVASHIDSPRLDLKQRPLYEDDDSALGMLETHYYGGIKKYQWVGIPLAIHGVVARDGRTMEFVVGEEDNSFTIADLPPHLGKKQGEQKISDAITGEELDLIAGGGGSDKKVKEALLRTLKEKHGLIEADFVRADLEVVPAFRARKLGFDGSMIGAYGQDDRICAFASMRAIGDVGDVDNTPMALFFDKEEVGSDGNTGMTSAFFENFLNEVVEKSSVDTKLYRILETAKAISADVTAAIHPNHKDLQDIKNSARLGGGIAIEKFTGHGGKYSASEATAEYISEIIDLFDRNGVVWQSNDLGKVDEGGGGTVAKFLARHNMDVIDAGPAILGMHSPFEVSSLRDLEESVKAYLAFFRS